MHGGHAVFALAAIAAAAFFARQEHIRRGLEEELEAAKSRLKKHKEVENEAAGDLLDSPEGKRQLAEAIGSRLDQKIEETKEPRRCHKVRAKDVREEMFYAEFLQRDRPVILKAGIKSMGNLRKWMDIKYLEQHYGDIRHEVVFPFNDLYAQPQGDKLESPFRKRMTFRRFIRELRNASSGNSSRMFIEQGPIWDREEMDKKQKKDKKVKEDDVFPMFRDIKVPHFARFLQDSLRVSNFWMGSHGEKPKVSALHFDGSDNLLAQVIGEKRFVVFPALESHHLHPKRFTRITRKRNYPAEVNPQEIEYDQEDKDERNAVDNFSPVLVDAPDLQRFPLYRPEDGIECVVKPGDVIYLPAFMWHNVFSTKNESVGVNIAVNLWFEPPHLLQNYHNVLHRILLDANEGT